MIHLNVHGLLVKVDTNSAPLAESIRSYYRLFLCEAFSEADMIVDLRRYGYFSRSLRIAPESDDLVVGDYVRMDVQKRRYFFQNVEISGTVEYQENSPILVTWILKPHVIRHWVNIILQGFSRIEKYYNRFAIKTLLHDPIFIELEKRFGMGILHATTVTDGKRTYLFTGLGGSGKSTMAATFHKAGYTILSDNYALVKGNVLYPFPELPRITSETSELLELKPWKKADGIKSYLENALGNVKTQYPIDAIFICSYGRKFQMEALRDSSFVFETLFSINNYTKEFPEYSNLALLSLMGVYNTWAARMENLREVAATNRVFWLQNTSNLSHIVEYIQNA